MTSLGELIDAGERHMPGRPRIRTASRLDHVLAKKHLQSFPLPLRCRVEPGVHAAGAAETASASKCPAPRGPPPYTWVFRSIMGPGGDEGGPDNVRAHSVFFRAPQRYFAPIAATFSAGKPIGSRRRGVEGPGDGSNDFAPPLEIEIAFAIFVLCASPLADVAGGGGWGGGGSAGWPEIFSQRSPVTLA